MSKILVVGDSILDRYWYCTPKGQSPEAPIMMWDVDYVTDKLGGAGNVVNNLVSLSKIYNLKTSILFATAMAQETFLAVPEEFPTNGIVVSLRAATIKNRIVLSSPYRQIVRFDSDNNNNPSKDEEKLILKSIKSKTFDVGLISDYSHGGVNRKFLEAARESCKKLIVDPKGNNIEKYSGIVDIITPNLKEMNDLLYGRNIRNIQEKIKQLSYLLQGNKSTLPKVILKRGEKGCVVQLEAERLLCFAAYRNERNIVDPTGAGDTFIATLAFLLAENKDYISAVKEANRLAGISVTFPTCWVPEKKYV